MTQSDIGITTCGDGSYCCGFNNTNCCNSLQGFWISMGQVYPYTASPFTAVSTSASQPTTSTTTSPLSTATNSSNSKNSTKLALGVGLGIGIPIVILLLITVALLLKQRNRNSMTTATNMSYPTQHAKTTSVIESPHAPQSLPVIPTRSELEAPLH